MPNTWPQNRRLLGTAVPRLDGPEKATGRAKYSFDINRPGMLHAKILRCPHARARVRSVNTQAAQALPGFRAVWRIPTALSTFTSAAFTTPASAGMRTPALTAMVNQLVLMAVSALAGF